MSLQEALKLMRMELGLTQDDLAKKISRTCLTVNRWENGKGFPTRKAANDILAMAKKSGVSADCLAYLSEVLLPESTRGASAAAYGFPDIDRDFLFQLADGSTNALYVIEAESYRLLYLNRRADEMAVQYRAEMGGNGVAAKPDRANTPCYRFFGGRDSRCSFCPLPEIEGSGYKDLELKIPESGRRVRVHAKSAVNRGKKVYIIYLTDLTQVNAERDALYELTNDIPEGVGIYHLYADNRIELVFMNTKWYQMIGEERQKAMITNALGDFCLLHPEDRSGLVRKVRSAAKQNRSASVDVRMKVRDGGYHPVHIDARVIRRDSEKTTFYCLFHEMEQT